MQPLTHRRFLRGVWICSFALAFCVSSGMQTACAQEQDEAVERARNHMEVAQLLFSQGRYDEAAREFAAAYESVPFSAFRYNMGVAYERAGRVAEAVEAFTRYLEQDPAASDRADVEARLRVLRVRLPTVENGIDGPATSPGSATGGSPSDGGSLPPTGGATGTTPVPADAPAMNIRSLLRISANAEGSRARILREGEEVASGPAPLTQALEAGAYQVVMEHPDYQSVTRSVDVEAGHMYVVIIEMTQGEFLGYLRVVSDVPGSSVYLDDREAGSVGTTPFATSVPAGVHRVWVDRPGYETELVEVTVEVAQTREVEVSQSRVDYGRLRVLATVGGAEVYVDDAFSGEVPFQGRVSSGAHRVRVRADGMKDYEIDLDILAGQLTPMRVWFQPQRDRTAAWVLATGALLTLGAGGGMAIAHWDLNQQLTAARDQGVLTSDDPRMELGVNMAIGANVAFGLSIILGAIALYEAVYDPLPESEGQVRSPRDWSFLLLPYADPENEGGGVSTRVSF